jgi:DNA-directed RNA polymerase subunit F
MVKLLQNTYDKNFDYDKENNVIKITNIKPERRADVRSQFAKFLKPQSPVKESLDFDFERYQMLRRAGIIK